MKCIICHGDSINKKEVMEEIRRGHDIICIKINILVCNSCGERYYDRPTIQRLETLKIEIDQNLGSLSEIGRVLVYNP